MLGVYGEEGLFLVCPVGQNTGFERVGRTFGTAQYNPPFKECRLWLIQAEGLRLQFYLLAVSRE